MLYIAEVSRNIHFLIKFDKFSQWVTCAIFQTNTDLLISFEKIYSLFTLFLLDFTVA